MNKRGKINPLRDYSLIGLESKTSIEQGLADAVWYTSPVAKSKMRELLVRKNGPAIRDTFIWFGIMIFSAWLTIVLWGTWWFILPYMIYAVLYASTSDSRWHESSHGTAFKSDWMNNTLYEISSFMVLRQSIVWRWSHTRHHSDTLVRGRDPEIAAPRPPDIKGMLLNFLALKSAPAELRRLILHATGTIDKEVKTYLPKSENRKVIFQARLYLFIFLVVIAVSIVFKTILPLMFIGIPTLVGSWLMPFYGLTQHAGLAENVLDHRLNCRTVYMNRIHRFLYWNMNYHIEHHMFPLVPYHALPKLHELIKEDCPPAYNGIISTFREIVPALLQQVKDPSYFVKRTLPTQSQSNNLKSTFLVASKNDIGSDGLVRVCRTNEIGINEVIRFDCDDETFAIYRTSETNFHASEGCCTHGNSHLSDGLIIGNLIECSKHNGRFNIEDGSVQRPPVCVGLKTYPIKIIDDTLFLDLRHVSGVNENNRLAFKVISNQNVATFIKELVIEPVNTNRHFDFQPGDYIHLEIPAHQTMFNTMDINEPFHNTWKLKNIFNYHAFNHTKTRRNYSMSNNPSQPGLLKFNVRIATPPIGINCQAGVGSSYVFNLKPGDTIFATGPFGDFHIKHTGKEMIYIGGGAGMAPLRSHISHLFETLKTNRKVSYWYGARSLQELFYNEYFEALEKNHSNFSFKVALSEPLETDEWNSHTGLIHEVFENNFLKKADINYLQNIEFYLCGPPAMIEAVQNSLAKYGIMNDQIVFDEF